jgi:hypothetical protein
MINHICTFSGDHTSREPNKLSPGHMKIKKTCGQRPSCRLPSPLRQPLDRYDVAPQMINYVKIGLLDAVHLNHTPIFDKQGSSWIKRALLCAKVIFGIFSRELIKS